MQKSEPEAIEKQIARREIVCNILNFYLFIKTYTTF